jgi:hypothetical protein
MMDLSKRKLELEANDEGIIGKNIELVEDDDVGEICRGPSSIFEEIFLNLEIYE